MKSQARDHRYPISGPVCSLCLLFFRSLRGMVQRRAECLTVVLFFLMSLHTSGWAGNKGVVAAGHPLATEAGLNAMKRGGNAVDAAVAVGLTLGVVDGFNSGIGGGCFILIHTGHQPAAE